MLRLLSLLIIFFPVITPQAPISFDNCQLNNINLYGNVRIVDSASDITVYIASSESFNSLEVEIVDFIPSNCGEWRITDRGEDFSIQIINDEALADLVITIRDTKEGRAFLKQYVSYQ